MTNNDKKDIVDVKEDEPVKKTRTVFKWYQLRMLEQAYNLTQHPNKYVVKDLSNKLNITEKVIKVGINTELTILTKMKKGESWLISETGAGTLL